MPTDVRISVTQTGDDYLRVLVDESNSDDLDANKLAFAVRRAVADSLREQGLLVEPEPIEHQKSDRVLILVLSDGETWEVIPESSQDGASVVAVSFDELARLRDGEGIDAVVVDHVRFIPLNEPLLPLDKP